MDVDPQGRKNYVLCLCRSHDCCNQNWVANDGTTKKGVWYSKSTKKVHSCVVEFLDDTAEQDDDMGDYSDADAEGEEDSDNEDADAEAANMAQFAEAMDQDADVDV
ncbi:hypothetical protein DFH09DRAFT_1086268 [Mycena vulgaris]|nr:hypothetical protein DFH09DRAFT_1086268 [Mycena vulgaris]